MKVLFFMLILSFSAMAKRVYPSAEIKFKYEDRVEIKDIGDEAIFNSCSNKGEVVGYKVTDNLPLSYYYANKKKWPILYSVTLEGCKTYTNQYYFNTDLKKIEKETFRRGIFDPCKEKELKQVLSHCKEL